MADETKTEQEKVEVLVPEIITNRDPGPRHHVKTPENANTVFRMAQMGLSKGAAAICLNVSMPTFEKYYSDEYKSGTIDMQQSLASMAFEAARAGSIPMLLHLVKTKLQWNEHSTVEHIGEVRAVVSNKPLTRDEFVRKYITKEDQGQEEPSD